MATSGTPPGSVQRTLKRQLSDKGRSLFSTVLEGGVGNSTTASPFRAPGTARKAPPPENINICVSCGFTTCEYHYGEFTLKRIPLSATILSLKQKIQDKIQDRLGRTPPLSYFRLGVLDPRPFQVLSEDHLTLLDYGIQNDIKIAGLRSFSASAPFTRRDSGTSPTTGPKNSARKMATSGCTPPATGSKNSGREMATSSCTQPAIGSKSSAREMAMATSGTPPTTGSNVTASSGTPPTT